MTYPLTTAKLNDDTYRQGTFDVRYTAHLSSRRFNQTPETAESPSFGVFFFVSGGQEGWVPSPFGVLRRRLVVRVLFFFFNDSETEIVPVVLSVVF